MKTYSMTHKNKIAIALLRWLRGWALLIDSIAVLITLGKFDPGLQIELTADILQRMVSDDNWE